MVKKITAAEFEEVLNSPAAVVDFSATWCGPCKMLAPVIEKVSDQMSDKAAFYNIDVDEAAEIARQYAIMSVPSVLIFRNGEEVGREIGFDPEPIFKASLEKYFK